MIDCQAFACTINGFDLLMLAIGLLVGIWLGRLTATNHYQRREDISRRITEHSTSRLTTAVTAPVDGSVEGRGDTQAPRPQHP